MEWKTIWIIGIGLMALLGSAMGMDDARGASITGSGLPPSYIFSGCDTLAQVNASGSIIVSASSIDSLAMRSGKLFAGGSNGVLSAIDIESKTWENVTTNSSINSIAVLPDGKSIAAGGSDGVVRVLDIASLTLVRTLAHGATNVWSVTAYGDHLVSGGGDKRIVFWNASTGAQELDVKASSSVRALAVGSNGTIAVGLYNGEISLLNPVSRNLTKLYSHTSITRSLAWSDDGSMLASVSSDKTLKIWGQNGSVVTVNAGTSGVYGVAWSGEHIITAGTDEHVRVWSANGSKERDFKIGSSVHSLASEGSSFAAGDLKGRVTLFSDTEPPSLVSSNAQYSNTNSTSIDFNGAFDECVSVDGASVSPTGWFENSTVASNDGTFVGSLRLRGDASDGKYVISLDDVRDLSNNSVLDIKVWEFVLDRTRPHVVNFTQSHPSPFPIGTIQLYTEFSEKMNGTVRIELDRANLSYDVVDNNWSNDGRVLTSMFEFTDQMPSGEYALRLTGGRDLAGNAMMGFNATLRLDSEPPVAEAGGDVTIDAGESATLDASNSTGAVRFAWSIQGKNYPGKVVEHRFFRPGQYPVTLTVYDEAGNSAADGLTVYVIDDSPPDMSIERPKKMVNGGTLIIVYNITDAGGVSRVEITSGSNGSEPATIDKSYSDRTSVDDQASLSLPMDGEYAISVEACDGSKNCNVSQPFDVVRDSVPPRLISHSPATASSTDVEVIMTFSESVNVSDVRCSHGAMPATLANDGPEVRMALRNLSFGGSYILTVKGSDAAGNAFSATVPFSVQVDAYEMIGPAIGFFSAGFAIAFVLASFALRKRAASALKARSKKNWKEPAMKKVDEPKGELDVAIRDFKESYTVSERDLDL